MAKTLKTAVIFEVINEVGQCVARYYARSEREAISRHNSDQAAYCSVFRTAASRRPHNYTARVQVSDGVRNPL